MQNNGFEIILPFGEALDESAGRTPPASAFTVTAAGSPVTVTGVQISSHLVILTVDPVITKDQAVTVSYRDPTPGDDEAALQDYAGNDVASFTDFAIPSSRQNSTILGTPANLTATGVKGGVV